MAKLTRKPRRPVLSRAKNALAATTMVVAIAGCGDDDGNQDAGMEPVGLTAPDAGPDSGSDVGTQVGLTAPDSGTADAGNDVPPAPGLPAFDAG